MTPDLDCWLQQATRSLSKDSTAQVRTEIQEHYQSAREAANIAGASQDEANRMALIALGDARIANTQYRRVLLTASEARLLQQGNREAGVVCSISGRQWLLLAVSLIPLLAAGALFRTGWIGPGRVTLALGLGIGFTILAPRLPIYAFPRTRVPLLPVDHTGWPAVAGLWPRRNENVVADSPLCLAVDVGGMEARLDSPQAARRRLAATTVSVNRAQEVTWTNCLC